MKALVYTAPHHVEMQNLAEPTGPRPDEVMVKVAAVGVCGSDLHGFHGRSKIRVPPMVMGHEFTGTIAALGENVAGLQQGQRVVVQPLVGCGVCVHCSRGSANICPDRQLVGAHRQGAFAEYVTVPARVVYPISDHLSNAVGTLVEPLANAVHMLDFGGNLLDRSVAVLGAGTLGLLTAALAHRSGARHVVVTDVDGHRLEVARHLGADTTIDALDPETVDRIRDLTAGGADLVVDAAGYTAPRQQGIAMAATGGTIVFLGLGEPNSELPILDIINRELTLRGSYSCSDDDFRRALSLLENGAIDTAGWVEITRLESGQAAFERLDSHDGGAIKIVFDLTR